MRLPNSIEVWMVVAFISCIPHTMGLGTATDDSCPSFNASLTLKAMTNVRGKAGFSCILSEDLPQNVEVQMIFMASDGNRIRAWFRIVVSPASAAWVTVGEMGIALYDKNITCTARPRFFVRGTQWCSEVISNTIHVAMKMDTSQQEIDLREGQPNKFVTVSFTAPPSAFCGADDDGNCRVEIATHFTTSSTDLKCPRKEIIPQCVLGVGEVGQTTKACGVLLTEENWSQELQIPVKATLDRRIDGNRETKLNVMVKITSQVTNDTSVIGQQSITVKIIDNNKNTQCASHSDPHLVTFDKKYATYSIPGEYVLYKHRHMEYEVRAISEACSNGATNGPTCNRGVAVRSVDDVISFTRPRGRIVSVQMYLNGDFTPGTRIYRHGSSGNAYEVHLPHGTVVTVRQWSSSAINVYIKPSSTDLNQTEGLCGNFNQRVDDDFDFDEVETFALKWKRTDSILRGVPAQKQVKTAVYCSCQENHAPRCEPNLDAFYCLTEQDSLKDITNDLTRQAQRPQVKTQEGASKVKRAVTENAMADNAAGRNDTTEWTLESAREYCESFLDSARQVKMCSDYLDTNETQQSIESCAFDVAALGDKDWASSHLDHLMDSCLTTATRVVAKWTQSNDTTETEFEGPPAEIVEGLCLLDCGLHGKCQYGACNCKDGWTGAQCNIGVDTQPDVLPAEEACDVLTSVSSCHVVGVEGKKFVPTSNLTCVFQFIEISESQIVKVGQPETVNAMYISQYKVICTQPDTRDQARSAFVAISNDGGETTSVERHLHAVYNASCYQCGLTEDGRDVTCAKADDSCHMDGRCFTTYERHEEDACYWCDPVYSQVAWTRTSEPVCQKDDEGITKTTIVFIVLGVLLALALIIIIVLVVRRKRKASQRPFTKPKKTDEEDVMM